MLRISSFIHVGYLGAGFDYFSKGFVHTPDQEIEAAQDRTRRALSNGLPSGPYISFQPVQNYKNLLKTYGSQEIPVAIRPHTGPKSINDTHRENLTRYIEWTPF